MRFTPQYFRMNRRKKLLQIGTHLRNTMAIEQVPRLRGMQRVCLSPDLDWAAVPDLLAERKVLAAHEYLRAMDNGGSARRAFRRRAPAGAREPQPVYAALRGRSMTTLRRPQRTQ